MPCFGNSIQLPICTIVQVFIGWVNRVKLLIVVLQCDPPVFLPGGPLTEEAEALASHNIYPLLQSRIHAHASLTKSSLAAFIISAARFPSVPDKSDQSFSPEIPKETALRLHSFCGFAACFVFLELNSWLLRLARRRRKRRRRNHLLDVISS